MADPISETTPAPHIAQQRVERIASEQERLKARNREAREDRIRDESYKAALHDTAFFADQASRAALDYAAHRFRADPSTQRALEALLEAAESYHTAFRHNYLARLKVAGVAPK